MLKSDGKTEAVLTKEYVVHSPSVTLVAHREYSKDRHEREGRQKSNVVYVKS